MAKSMYIAKGVLEQCLPSLEMLNDHGVEYLDLLFEFVADGGYRTAVIFPRFFDYDLRLTPASREDVESAYRGVSEIIGKALRNATQALFDEGQLHGFIATVKFDCCFRNEMGWKVSGEITATAPISYVKVVLQGSSAGQS